LPPVEPFTLPQIPSSWTPDSVSKADKKAALVEYAENNAGFPARDISEYCYIQKHIQTVEHLKSATNDLYGKRKGQAERSSDAADKHKRTKIDIWASP